MSSWSHCGPPSLLSLSYVCKTTQSPPFASQPSELYLHLRLLIGFKTYISNLTSPLGCLKVTSIIPNTTKSEFMVLSPLPDVQSGHLSMFAIELISQSNYTSLQLPIFDSKYLLVLSTSPCLYCASLLPISFLTWNTGVLTLFCLCLPCLFFLHKAVRVSFQKTNDCILLWLLSFLWLLLGKSLSS